MVDNAPCKEVTVKGEDVDLTVFPLFFDRLARRCGASETVA
jgi:hypothetical protein